MTIEWTVTPIKKMDRRTGPQKSSFGFAVVRASPATDAITFSYDSMEKANEARLRMIEEVRKAGDISLS
jgi:hypothetical protein